jgi:molecular chaperone GrpE
VSGALEENGASPVPNPGTAVAASDVQALKAALTAAEESARASRDQYLRALAELDNVRKRSQRDVENAHRYALEKFALELLPVRDGLELAARSGAAADAKSLLDGQASTLKLLARAFEKFQITAIEPVGEAFDPTQHEAMMAQESGTAAPNSVLQVLQPGYLLNGRVLRPARVIVAKAPEGRGAGPGSTG